MSRAWRGSAFNCLSILKLSYVFKYNLAKDAFSLSLPQSLPGKSGFRFSRSGKLTQKIRDAAWFRMKRAVSRACQGKSGSRFSRSTGMEHGGLLPAKTMENCPCRVSLIANDGTFSVACRSPADNSFKEPVMLHWILIFLLIAAVASLLGFRGVAGASAGIAKILIFIVLVIFIIALVSGIVIVA
ncbi:hypothetical transmembrane protein [Allorhizobium ampelinum S4]|uniref:UPF0391 membrane protein Avi_5986 n=2 Tax=Rhizobium/Agrobacterium group TaxID=227290 RepID=B9K2B2_ALLAM|nr:hypothetical transmembrane protein [Allorhizobium ampelinum S4]